MQWQAKSPFELEGLGTMQREDHAVVKLLKFDRPPRAQILCRGYDTPLRDMQSLLVVKSMITTGGREGLPADVTLYIFVYETRSL